MLYFNIHLRLEDFSKNQRAGRGLQLIQELNPEKNRGDNPSRYS